MYARFGTVHVKEGKLDEFVTTFRDSMVPPARAQKGFKGVSVLADHENGTVVLISLWKSEADARAMATTNAAISAQADKIKELVVAMPDVQYLEVMLQEQ